MPRAHRLPPIIVSHEQVFHAYTSPPIPEKGAPPTIIVTPAEPMSTHDFQIHFFSPTPSRSTFLPPSSFLSKFLSRLPRPALVPNRRYDPIGLGISTPDSVNDRTIGTYNGYQPYSPVPTHEHGTIRFSGDEDEFDGLVKRKEKRWSATKKMRTTLFLMLPMLLVLFHIVSARMGYGLGFDVGIVEMEAPHDDNGALQGDLWEWIPSPAAVIDDLQRVDAVLEMKITTTTADTVDALSGTRVEDDTL